MVQWLEAGAHPGPCGCLLLEGSTVAGGRDSQMLPLLCGVAGVEEGQVKLSAVCYHPTAMQCWQGAGVVLR